MQNVSLNSNDDTKIRRCKMVLRCKGLIKTVFIVFAIVIMSGLFDSVLAQNIPVPPKTEETKQERRIISGAELKFTYYKSQLNISQIKDFYRSRLGKLGWQESEVLKDLQQNANINIDRASLDRTVEDNTIFSKEGVMTVINFIPAGVLSGKETRFTICQGKIDFSVPPSEDTAFVPELLDKPKKEVTPVYPGASLMSLTEDKRSLKATYFSKDSVDSVMHFYKEEMPNYGWELTDETPGHKVSTGDCPTCPASGVNMNKPVDMVFGELVFANENKDNCRLGFSRIVTEQEIKVGPGFNFTIILVDYGQKKK